MSKQQTSAITHCQEKSKQDCSKFKINGYAEEKHLDIDFLLNNEQKVNCQQRTVMELSENELVNMCFSHYVKIREDSSSKISQLPQKFIDIQKQVIEVVEFRKDLQKQHEISKLHGQYFEIIHKLIQRNKGLQQNIDTLSTKIKELQNQHLNAKYLNSFPQNEQFEIELQAKTKRKRRQHKDDVSNIFNEISYIKKTIQNMVSCSESDIIQAKRIDGQHTQNIDSNSFNIAQANPQERRVYSLQNTLKLQSKQLQLRLQIIQQNSFAQKIYSQSQCELIQNLMSQLIQIKKQVQNYRKKYLFLYLQTSKLQNQQKKQQTEFQQSQKSLITNEFQVELIKMKQIQQNQQKIITQLREQISSLKCQANAIQSRVKQKQTQIELKQLQIREEKLKLQQFQFQVKELTNKNTEIQKEKIQIIGQLQEKLELSKKSQNYLEGKCELLEMAAKDLRKQFTNTQKANQQMKLSNEQFYKQIKNLQAVQAQLMNHQTCLKAKLHRLQEQKQTLLQKNNDNQESLKVQQKNKKQKIKQLEQLVKIHESEIKSLNKNVQRQKEQNNLLQQINCQLQIEKQRFYQQIEGFVQFVQKYECQIKMKNQDIQHFVEYKNVLDLSNVKIKEQNFELIQKCNSLIDSQHKLSLLLQNLLKKQLQKVNQSLQTYDESINQTLLNKRQNLQNWHETHQIFDNTLNILSLKDDYYYQFKGQNKIQTQ